MSRRGPRTAVTPAELLAILDANSELRTGGYPTRTRRWINGRPVGESDARMIRRWRAGTIKGVTKKSANALLKRYRLDPIK